MKKIIIYLFSALLFINCSPSKYKIDGEVENMELNATKIFLKERINREWITIDSIEIKDNKFSLEGVCDSSRVVFLFCELPNNEKFRQAFILENADIKVILNSTGFRISGTKQNDILQKYNDEKAKLQQEAQQIYKSDYSEEMTAEAKKTLEQKMDSLNKIDKASDLQYSIDNINTIVGTHIFSSSFYAMSTDEKEKVTKLMNEETKKISRIAEIISAIDIEKKTATGQIYSDIKLPSITGDSIALSDMVGKTDFVLVDFWASWCGPCIQSLPELKALYSKYHGEKFEILGVSLDDDEQAWKNMIKAKELNWYHISDLQGWKSRGAKLYAVSSIPATVLINKLGVIEGRNLSIDQIELILQKSGE